MEGFEPSRRFPGLSAFGADLFTCLSTSPKRRHPDSNRDAPPRGYSRFSKPLPYLLGLYRQKRRRQDSNLHAPKGYLFSRQGLHRLSDCGMKFLRHYHRNPSGGGGTRTLMPVSRPIRLPGGPLHRFEYTSMYETPSGGISLRALSGGAAYSRERRT